MKRFVYIIVIISCFFACKKNDVVDFSFAPTEPKAGETVRFSNLTAEGEEWAWDFGDGGTSTLNSPSRVYKEPGTYTVTLKVDNKNTRTRVQVITVVDTVPNITPTVATIGYYQTITLQAAFYNPYSENVTYKWTLPESATIISGDVTSSQLQVFFTKREAVTVNLTLTVGSQTFDLKANYTVEDVAAPTLWMLTKNGLIRQRFYTNGAEMPEQCALAADIQQHAHRLLWQGDTIYVLGKGINAFVDGQVEHLIPLLADKQVVAGYITDNTLYWVDSTTLNSLSLSSSTNQEIANLTALIVCPHTVFTGVGVFASNYYLAGDKGIYVLPNNLSSAMCLVDKKIEYMALDALARKIYYLSEGNLYVVNVNGENLVRLAENITSIAVDNVQGQLYMTTAEGVSYMPLIQTSNNTTTAKPTQLTTQPSVRSVAMQE